MTGGTGQGPAATLEDVLITAELARRPSPAPDLRAENDALHDLAQRIARQPRAALDAIATVASQLCRCGSAGLTVLETLASGEEVVRWVALAGELRRHIATRVPFQLSMSRVCLDRNAPQLFKYPSRYFTYLAEMAPPLVEALVIPVHVEGRAFGTILTVAHDESREFDREDVRLLTSLANFSAALLEARERERSTIAELERASRAKDEFLATVSHELRTPLTAVLGWTRLLMTGRRDHDVGRRAIEVIDRNAQILSRLVSDLLDVSRIITGRMALTVRPVDLVPIIAASIDAMRPAVEAKGIDLAVTVVHSETWVLGDGARLQQVMWNLLSNAVKFTPNGGRIRVDLVKTDRVARITVTDTGRGIRPEFLPRVFERFTQADGAYRRAQEGLGLGLAIVRHLVELHGGTVLADSPGQGHGATFTVELPLTSHPDPGARADSDDAVSEVRPLLGLRIAIVENDLDTSEMLATALANEGADVITANSAREAQRVLRSFGPHIMVCDVALPDQDGYALVRAMRQDPGTASMRCVALTGYGGEGDRNEALAAGFDRHLTKPVDPVALVRLLADLIDA